MLNSHLVTAKTRRNLNLIKISLFLLELYCISLWAQDTEVDYVDMDIKDLLRVPIVTIATGVQQSATQAPAVTSVITAADIEEMGAGDIDEVLAVVPGLHVTKDSNYNSVYTIRGIYTNFNAQMLVLVNGISINLLLTGNRGAMWREIPVNAIARIEIIRGPGSAVFGADAFAGVINIITKQQTDIQGTQTGIRVGSFATRKAWLLHGDVYGKFKTALTLEYGDTDGQRKTIEEDIQTFFDEVYGTHVSYAPGPINLQQHSLNTHLDIAYEHWRMRLGYQKHYNVGTGTSYSLALDPSGRGREQHTNADLTYDHPNFMPHWDVAAQISYFGVATEIKNNVFPPGAFGGTYPQGYTVHTDFAERTMRANLTGLYQGFTDHKIRLGTGYAYGSLYKWSEQRNFNTNTNLPLSVDGSLVDVTGTDQTTLPTENRSNWFVFLQDAYTFAPNWELTMGLRYDHYSDSGHTINPRAALVWQQSSGLTTKLLYGKAFRAPSFNELYARNNPVSSGNSSLRPEKIETIELVFDYKVTTALHVATNLFTYKWRNGIEFLPDPSGVISASNIGSNEGRGVEVEARWQVLKNLGISGHYAYSRIKDLDESQNVGNSPQHMVYLQTDWQFLPQWSLHVQGKKIGKRGRLEEDERPYLAGYTWVDAVMRYKSSKNHWNIAAGIHNLLDADAREPSPGPSANDVIGIPHDFPLAGRNYFIEVRYNF